MALAIGSGVLSTNLGLKSFFSSSRTTINYHIS